MKKIVFMIVLLFTILLTAQKKTSEIQKVKKSTTDSEILIQQKIDKEVNSLNRNILENTKRTIGNESRIEHLFITKVGFQGVSIGLLIAFLGFFGLGKKVKRKFQLSIDNVKEAEIRTIEHIKNSERDNKELRSKSQILLVNEVTTPINEDLQRIFIKGSSKVQFNCTQVNISDLTFKKIKNELVNQKGPHPTDFELIIFDNSSADGRKWGKDALEEDLIPLVKQFLSRGIGVLYYSNDQFFPSDHPEYRNISNKHLLTYANVVPSLYNNAMTVLKLQNLYRE